MMPSSASEPSAVPDRMPSRLSPPRSYIDWMNRFSAADTLTLPSLAASTQPFARYDGMVSEYIEDLSPRKSGIASVPFSPP